MITASILEVFFSQGAKATEVRLQADRDAGLLSKEVVSTRDVANLQMLMLLLRQGRRELGENHIREAVAQIEGLDMPDGARIVYFMLLLDLARECQVSLKFARETHAAGSDIDWELMDCLKRSTPRFLAKANYLADAHKKSRSGQGVVLDAARLDDSEGG